IELPVEAKSLADLTRKPLRTSALRLDLPARVGLEVATAGMDPAREVHIRPSQEADVNVVANIAWRIDAGHLALGPAVDEIGAEPRLLEWAEGVRNYKLAKRQSKPFCPVAKHICRQAL